jgi:small-conductance mechanosensitive channel
VALVVLCAGLFAPGANAWAQENAAPSENSSAESVAIPQAPVQVNGRVLFQIIGTDAADALRRADKVNRRLENQIKREEDVPPFTPGDIRKTDGDIAIVLGGEEVLTVTPADSQHYLKTPVELAQEWGVRLSRNVQRERLARSGTVNNILVLMGAAMYDLVKSVIQWLPRLLGAFVLALVFWLLARLVRWLADLATRADRIDPNLRQLTLAVAYYGVWGLGLLAVLSALGIDSASIAATIGISGFVLGFAFKDVLSHFFAGLLLLLGRQFTIGGQIIVGEFEGIVEKIDLRALHLRTFDNRLVTIPNGEVFNSPVIANTYNRFRRREFMVGIGYEDDAREAIQLALQAVQSVEGVLIEPPPQVVATEFGLSAIQLRVLFFTSTSNPDPLTVVSECILRVHDKFNEAGITIPFNTHTVDLRNAGELLQPSNTALPLEAARADKTD